MYNVRFGNKYNAKKTEYQGYRYDSRFEASVAAELDIRLKAGEIVAWERQYKLVMPVYDSEGNIVHTVNHKVDFRLEYPNGTFELLEAKGFETMDYKFRRTLLEKVWLNDHPDYFYTVVKQYKRR